MRFDYWCYFLLLQVLQYKKRCGDLDQALQEKSSELEKNSVGDLEFTVNIRKPIFMHRLKIICPRSSFDFRVTAKHRMVAIKMKQAATWRML